MKTRVRVEIEKTEYFSILMEVEHEEGDDPTDLNENEEQVAFGLAEVQLPDNQYLKIESVEEVTP